MPDRRPGTRWSRGVVLWPVLVLCATACGGPVTRVEVGELSAADEAACDRVLADVPHSLGDRDRLPVEPAGAPGAAWGDGIVMTCGVASPELAPTAVCQEADGVGWYVEGDALDDESVDVVMSTAGYRPVVEVVVPAAERPEGVAAAMAGLADAVSRNTELVRPCV